MNKYLKTLTLIQLAVAVTSTDMVAPDHRVRPHAPTAHPHARVCYAWFFSEPNFKGTRTCMGIKPNGELQIAAGSVPFRSIKLRRSAAGHYNYRLKMWKNSDYLGSITSSNSEWSEDYEGATKFKLELIRETI